MNRFTFKSLTKQYFNLVDIKSISRIQFRNDITGLRAIAVLSVLFYHADFELFKGGWLGVDIFFMISGYLISNIIVSELNNKKFKFKLFYQRRIERIFPALFSTLLITIPFTFYLFDPKSLLQYTKSLISSTFFYSNFYFNNLDFYNEAPAKLMPLLHTWSLSIEEQFYIIFPILLYFLHRYSKSYFFQTITILFLLSLFWNSTTDSLEKFYMLEFRFWELSLGLLIMVMQQKVVSKNLDVLGFILLISPIFYYDDSYINQIEPKIISLFGLSLLLLNSSNSIIKRVLNNSFLQKTGLISFSLYLLHQPIFSIARKILYGQFLKLELYQSMILILFSFFLATQFYKYVELGLKNNIHIYKILFSIFFIISTFSYFSIKSNGFEYRFANIYETLSPYYSDQQRSGPSEENCKKIYNELVLDSFCYIKSSNETDRNLVLIGDSHLVTLSNFLSINVDNYNLFILTSQGCPFIVPDLRDTQANCATLKSKVEFEYITESSESTVIYGGRFPWYFNGDSFRSNLGSTNDNMNPGGEKLLIHLKQNIDYLKERSNKLILLTPIPELGVYPLEPYQSGHYKINQALYFDYSYWKDYSKETVNLIQSTNDLQTYIVYSEKVFCDSFISNMCVAAYDSQFFYYDDDHLTYDGSALIGKLIIDIIN
jgi:peptidoglycan/LPS O-acetylase OafA/YrhL